VETVRVDYTLVRPRRGRLNSPHYFDTPITGYSGDVFYTNKACSLAPDGRLTCYAGMEWDFATGAIDTPAMVIASMAHDAFCYMTNLGALPWEVRKKADDYFRDLLRGQGASWPRSRWCWAAVRFNSKFISYWKRPK